MVSFQDIHSLADFQCRIQEHLERLKKSGRPEVLRVRGEAELIVQDAQAYRVLLDRVDRAEAVAGIQRGLESKNRGEGRPMREAMRELAEAHGVELDR